MINIIIINYFSLTKIEHLLAALYEQKNGFDEFNVIIVSNSSEKEIAELPVHYPSIRIIQNEENIGFGRACNKALPYCKGEFVLLLNPDTLINKHTLEKCVDAMDEKKEVAVLGVKHVDADGRTAPSCSRFPTLINFVNEIFGLTKLNPRIFKSRSTLFEMDYSKSTFVPQVMGAFMFIRKSFIDNYGLMDERYFVFGEDMDFCKKVWANGGKVFYESSISIMHEGCASTEGITDKRLCYSLEGKLKYAYKHLGKISWFVILLLVIFVEPFTRLAFGLVSSKEGNIKNTLKGYRLFFTRRQWK